MRYCIVRERGKWFVHDDQLKQRVGDQFKGSTKDEARERARLLNSQQHLHDEIRAQEER